MRIVILIFCSLWLLVPESALAWGARGHIAIAQIAEANLSSAQLEQVRKILSQDPNPSQRRIGLGPLATVATWADEIRSSNAMPSGAARWHYRNNSVCTGRVGSCMDGDCIDAKIDAMMAVLANNKVSDAEKATALKWLVHLVGDIHQPLHVGDNGDRGGNLVTVALAESKTRGRISLHKAWDTNLVDLVLDRDDLVPARLSRSIRVGTPAMWMEEGRAIAANAVYKDLPGFTCGANELAPIVLLTREYQSQAKTVITERLQIAGVRLAALLRHVLD